MSHIDIEYWRIYCDTSMTNGWNNSAQEKRSRNWAYGIECPGSVWDIAQHKCMCTVMPCCRLGQDSDHLSLNVSAFGIEAGGQHVFECIFTSEAKLTKRSHRCLCFSPNVIEISSLSAQWRSCGTVQFGSGTRCNLVVTFCHTDEVWMNLKGKTWLPQHKRMERFI